MHDVTRLARLPETNHDLSRLRFAVFDLISLDGNPPPTAFSETWQRIERLFGQGERIHRDVVMELDQYPEDRTERDLERHVAPAIRGHMRDFLEAIRTRGRPVADIEQGHISTATCILANLSQQLNRTLTWDAERQRVVGDDEANRLLRRPYRQPWVHPEA